MLFCNICKYTYDMYILLKCTKPSRICDCDHDSKVRRFMPRIQVHLTFIIQLVICTLIMLCLEI